MSEKIKPPRTPDTTPSIPPETAPETQNEGGFVPTEAEERVLAVMHEKTAAHRGEKVPRDEALLNRLHQDVEHCECYPLYQKYASGELPTIKRMFANLEPLLTELGTDIEKEIAATKQGGDTAHITEMQQTQRLLMGREKQVRDAIQRYVNSVIRFRHLAKLSIGGTRDVSKQFEEADHSRRRAHNALIESLSVYVRQMHKLADLGYDKSDNFPFVPWQTHMDARQIDASKTPIMSETVLKNRDFVRDWAIVADFKDQLELLGDES